MWDGTFAPQYEFPSWLPEAFEETKLRGVFQCAMVHMAGEARVDSRVLDFLESTVPRGGQQATARQEMALDLIADWRRHRNIRMRRPPARGQRAVAPAEGPVSQPRGEVEEELYEPPGDLSEGHVSTGCRDSLGSIGDLVDHPVNLTD